MTTASTESDLSVQVERKPGSQVTLTIEAPAQEVDRAIESALRRLASRMRVPGFRPGKAPAAVVERNVGWDRVRHEALDDLLPIVYLKAINEAGIDPVGEPSIDIDAHSIERGKGIKLTATVVVKPDVDLGDYLSIRVEEPKKEITDKDIEEALEEVRRLHSTLQDTDRAAALGDVVRCTLKMLRDEEVLSGETGEERDLELDPDKLLPGLAPSAVGLKAGEQKTFPLTLPEDFSREDLRGKEVSVEIDIKAVRERVLPPLDDELAKLDKHGETVAELREHYKQALIAEAEREMTEKFESEVLQALRDCVKVDVPELMVNAEIDRELRDLEYRFSAMGISWEQYLQYSGETIEKLRGERRENAAQRVKLELALDMLASTEGLEVDELAITRSVKQMSEGRKVTAEQKRRLHSAAQVDLRRQGAVQRLSEIARGEG